MKILYANNASSTLQTGILDSDLALTVASGEGDLFPSPGTNEVFFVTLMSDTNMEIVKVTERDGDDFTIERAQENTTAHSFSSDDKVELLITAGLMEDLRDNSIRTDSLDTVLHLNADKLDNAEATDFYLKSDNIKISHDKLIDFGSEYKEDIKFYTNYRIHDR